MRQISSNISKRKRARRPEKPEFGFTGVISGLFIGWLFGAGIEFALGKPTRVIMFAAGLAGVCVGAAYDAVRFLWRKRRYRDASRSYDSSTSILSGGHQ